MLSYAGSGPDHTDRQPGLWKAERAGRGEAIGSNTCSGAPAASTAAPTSTVPAACAPATSSGAPIRIIPTPNPSPGWIAEHVWVMSQMLGRPLRHGESVHHINNIKGDNRPENLELWHTHQPKGARVEDTVRWAHWFLEQ